MTVSCDLNYRKKLWSEEEAQREMSALMKYVDVVIGNEEDAEKVLGIKAADSDVTSGRLCTSDYEHTASEITRIYGIKKVAFTMRESLSASDNKWSAMYFDDGKMYTSRKYSIHIVNRVGGGDAFASGLIYAMMHKYKPMDMVNFAVASSALKHTIRGDGNITDDAETIRNLMNMDYDIKR